MKGWMVRLTGDAFDLAEMAKLFATTDATVIRDGAHYYLTSLDFEATAQAANVYGRAKVLLARLNDIATFCEPIFREVHVEGVARVMPDGSRPIAFFESGRLECRSKLSGTPTFMDSTDKPVRTKTADPMRDLKRAANQHQAVASALHFFRIGDWISLYKVYEIVKDDVGGKKALTSTAWVTKDKLNLFSQTAQSRDAVGDVARHGSQRYRAPAKPMDLSRAKTLIRNLINKWVTTK